MPLERRVPGCGCAADGDGGLAASAAVAAAAGAKAGAGDGVAAGVEGAAVDAPAAPEAKLPPTTPDDTAHSETRE